MFDRILDIMLAVTLITLVICIVVAFAFLIDGQIFY